MFNRILVANRGEIAHRIINVLNGHGVETVAVYSEADAESPHVKAATEAVCIGPPPVAESYLRQDVILQAAKDTGAQAIHPGYGLLSENAGFARACAAAGLVFIGPTPEAIEAMGDKAVARALASKAGVPVVPGSDGLVEDDEAAARLADELGYPVLVKATGGGGGIGMALVKKPSKLQRALDSCRDRGKSSFDNAGVYLEKFIENPRHIEVQVLFDQHGHGVHLFERECSLQRRHQKVIEEAPSPLVERIPGMREALCEAALKTARAANYRNAGTVEFVADEAGNFYFIEMNTRLQVEHPITELITGVDLITWQARIAAGEPLTIQQADLKISGAAVECRLYAEDPDKRFMPQPGDLTAFAPPTMEGVRTDSGVVAGQAVTPYYDPLIAKLIASGATRDEALDRAEAALRAFVVEGIKTNRDFMADVLAEPNVRAGDFHTKWLEAFAKSRG